MEHFMKSVALTAVALLALSALLPPAGAQWDDCRFGETDCTGQCGTFIDTDGDGICDYSQPAPGERLVEAQSGIETLQGAGPGESLAAAPAGRTKSYDLVFITALLAAAYAATYLLARKGRMSMASHRKLWNVFLLATFLAVGALGLLMVIRINYGWAFLQSFFMLYWHVEAGIAMAIISIFHAAWHWRYYACMLSAGKKGKGSKGGKTCKS